MRSLLALSISMLVVSLGAVGCSAPSVASFEGEGRDLPRRGSSDDADAEEEEDEADSGDTGSTSSSNTTSKHTLTVSATGDGTGGITSVPAGVTCTGKSCKGEFAAGTKVTLAAQPQAGSIFAGWTGGGCTGSASCETTLAEAATVTAQFITLAGSWTGTYEHTQKSGNCTFNNRGNLENTIAGSTTFTTAAQVNGLEIRNTGNCGLVDTRDGTASPSAATVSGNKVTGTWTFKITGISGTLSLPFEGTIVGNKMNGKWTCTGCTGKFDISKQL